jgi:phenylacetate-CoA ligase
MAIDFRVRDFFHPVLITRLWREFERNPWLPPDELRRYQERRLRWILERAYGASPYYRRAFDAAKLKPSDIRTLDDLARLPVLTKEDARNRGTELRTTDSERFHPVECHTSGTSGTPFSVFHCRHANALEFVYYWRHWSWAGYRLGDRFAELSSYYFLDRPAMNDLPLHWQPLLRRLMLNSHRLSAATAPAMASAIERHRPRFLKGVASTLYHFALSLKEAKAGPVPFRAVFSTGEVLPPQRRALIESMFGCPVLDSYGHMERTVAISQCPEGGHHVNSDYGILEFINVRTSNHGSVRLANGLGTGLHNVVMPFIRYEIGDEYELFPEPRPCPCGRTFPLVKAIHGRMEDTIITPDGRFLTSLFLLPEFVHGIRETQFVQETASQLVIRVVPTDAFDSKEEAKLHACATRLVGASMNVRVARSAAPDMIRSRSGKLRLVISLSGGGEEKESDG